MNNYISKLGDCKKLAIMGGTFDPIHHGHLVAAQAVRDEFNTEMVLFIPTGKPPHKTGRLVSDNEHRYLMTVLATASNPHFWVSRIEIERPGKTYTIDTIKEIQEICPKDMEIYFITGADAVHEILTWKNAEELLGLCNFIAVTRPGYNKELLLDEISGINNKYKGRLHFLEVPALAISSTDIRNRIAMEKKIKYLLPNEVETYIIKNNLYTSAHYPEYSKIQERVKGMLKSKRYRHTLAVAMEAAKLAKIYNCDEKQAYLAGLVHDCAKELPPDKRLELCKQYGVKIDKIMEKQMDLVHSYLGAEIALHKFDIQDKDILNAIRYHTTGRRKMSLLEKILYIADLTEPNRETDEQTEELRKLSMTDINQALICAIDIKIKYTEQRGRIIHPLSLDALKYYNNNQE